MPLIFIYIFILPGFLLMHLSRPRVSIAEKICAGCALSIALIPIFSFGAAMLAETFISIPLLASVATFCNSVLLFIFYLERKNI